VCYQVTFFKKIDILPFGDVAFWDVVVLLNVLRRRRRKWPKNEEQQKVRRISFEGEVSHPCRIRVALEKKE